MKTVGAQTEVKFKGPNSHATCSDQSVPLLGRERTCYRKKSHISIGRKPFLLSLLSQTWTLSPKAGTNGRSHGQHDVKENTFLFCFLSLYAFLYKTAGTILLGSSLRGSTSFSAPPTLFKAGRVTALCMSLTSDRVWLIAKTVFFSSQCVHREEKLFEVVNKTNTSILLHLL